jgi:uncharacterized protein (TIGR02996 family)
VTTPRGVSILERATFLSFMFPEGGMRSFEFRDGTSSKFWNIELSDRDMTVTFGRIGSAGQSKTKTFATAAAALEAHDKLIAEKTGKGYVEKTASATPPGPSRPGPSEGSPLHKLEQGIIENPNDRAVYGAYADCLMEEGDPRGEFVATQVALEEEGRSTAERRKLQQREQALLKAHQNEWIGDWLDSVPKETKRDLAHLHAWNLDLPGPQPYAFIHGVLAQISINVLPIKCARAIAASPQTRLVTRLAIGRSAWDHEEEDEEIAPHPKAPEAAPALYELLAWPGLGNLHFFQLGHEPKPGSFNCHCQGVSLITELVGRMPRLEELHLFATRFATADLYKMKTLQNLRVLRVYHTYHCDLERLARNPALTRLTHLLLHPHAMDHGDDSYIRLPGLRALLRSAHIKNLTHLQLVSADFGDEGCSAIVESGILKRLRMLDLRQGAITDEGARILAAAPDVGKLEILDLRGNQLTAEGIRALRQANPHALPESAKKNASYTHDGDIE